jgi:uncharacterized protein with HEPN domain
MTNETRQRLLDVLLSCRAIDRYTAGLDFAEFDDNEMVQDAVVRRLGIIGEALNRAAVLEPNLAERIPELGQIVGLRNRVIHGYDSVDNEIVWDVIKNKLPGLETQVGVILRSHESRRSVQCELN